MFWELKPRTVIELGAYKGGSALWAADMLKMIGVTSRVLSMDIDLSLLDPVAKAYPDVTFIQGDSLEIDKCFPPELLQVRKSIAICAKMSIFDWREEYFKRCELATAEKF